MDICSGKSEDVLTDPGDLIFAPVEDDHYVAEIVIFDKDISHREVFPYMGIEFLKRILLTFMVMSATLRTGILMNMCFLFSAFGTSDPCEEYLKIPLILLRKLLKICR